MFHGRTQGRGLGQKLLAAVDLTIDLATLGEYGLEPLPADGPCREQAECRPTLRRSDWEELPTARRGACGHGSSHAVDFRGAIARFGS
jgi:hypothetical protein